MSKFRRLYFIPAFVLICTFAMKSSTRAASRLTEDFAELMRLSDAIVEVEVLSTEAQPPAEGRPPLTVAALRIIRVHKGELKAGDNLSVEYVGGFENGQRVIAPGQPELAAGDIAILLLRAPAANPMMWRIIGGDAGHVIIDRQHGKNVARRAAGTFEFFVPDPSSFTGYSAVKAPVVLEERLEEIITAISTKGRPVLEKAASQNLAVPMPKRTAAPALLPTSEPSLLARLAMIVAIISGGWLLLQAIRLRLLRN